MNAFIRSLCRCHCLFHFNDLTGYCFIAAMQNSFIWTRECCVMQEHPWRCFEDRHSNHDTQTTIRSCNGNTTFFDSDLRTTIPSDGFANKHGPNKKLSGAETFFRNASFKLIKNTKDLTQTQRKPMHDLLTTESKEMWNLASIRVAMICLQEFSG